MKSILLREGLFPNVPERNRDDLWFVVSINGEYPPVFVEGKALFFVSSDWNDANGYELHYFNLFDKVEESLALFWGDSGLRPLACGLYDGRSNNWQDEVLTVLHEKFSPTRFRISCGDGIPLWYLRYE